MKVTVWYNLYDGKYEMVFSHWAHENKLDIIHWMKFFRNYRGITVDATCEQVDQLRNIIKLKKYQFGGLKIQILNDETLSSGYFLRF